MRYWLAACAAIATPVQAQTLWQQIYAGMPDTELRSRYPAEKGRVEYHDGWTELKGFVQVGSCKPDVSVSHPQGVVTKVKIEKIAMAGMFTKTCESQVYSGLLAKYGDPISQESDKENFLNASEWKNRKTIWIIDDLTITLERGLDMHQSWKLNYESSKRTATGL